MTTDEHARVVAEALKKKPSLYYLILRWGVQEGLALSPWLTWRPTPSNKPIPDMVRYDLTGNVQARVIYQKDATYHAHVKDVDVVDPAGNLVSFLSLADALDRSDDLLVQQGFILKQGEIGDWSEDQVSSLSDSRSRG